MIYDAGPYGVRGETPDGDRAPQRCRNSWSNGNQAKGGAASGKSSDQSQQAASRNKKGEFRAVGEEASGVESWRLKSKVPLVK